MRVVDPHAVLLRHSLRSLLRTLKVLVDRQKGRALATGALVKIEL